MLGQVAGLIPSEVELCNAIALAHINTQIDKCGNGRIGNMPVRGPTIVGNLHRNCLIIVVGAAGRPWTVCFIQIPANIAVFVNGIGCRHPPRGTRHKSAELLQSQTPGHMVDGNFFNSNLFAITDTALIAVWANLHIACKRAVAHSSSSPFPSESSFSQSLVRLISSLFMSIPP